MARTVDLVTALRVGRDRLRHRGRRLCTAVPSARRPSANDLIPLQLAALSIFRQVYDGRIRPARLDAHLDALAYTIAELVPLYVYERDGRALRPLTEAELADGLFRDGARGLCYPDGRAPIDDLAVSVKDVQAVIWTLLVSSDRPN